MVMPAPRAVRSNPACRVKLPKLPKSSISNMTSKHMHSPSCVALEVYLMSANQCCMIRGNTVASRGRARGNSPV